MHSRLRSIMRRVAILLVTLLSLSQAGCATVGFSASMKPGSGDGGSTEPPGGGSSSASTGNIVAIVSVAFIGGYLLYRALTYDPPKEEGAQPPEGRSGGADDVPSQGAQLTSSG